ncbi:MAG: AI-2E family transporter, partial [Pseudomonadota bacterium]
MAVLKHDRFRNFVYGVALTIMIGYVLYIGQNVFIPVIASVIVAYIVIALAQRMGDIPYLGRLIPRPLRYAVSIIIIIAIIGAIIFLIMSNINQLIALLPQYQARLLSIIQNLTASFGEEFGIETQPTWETIRRDVFGNISLQSLIGSTVTSVGSIVGSAFVVIVYSGFALAERQLFDTKMRRLSSNPNESRRIVEIVSIINTRIGDYLVTKTLVNLLLGLISYIVMAAMDLNFAAFWAVVIALLNYIPYVGSFLGVLFPSAIGLVEFPDLTSALILFGGLTACQIMVGSLIEPSLMGRSLNLSPFVILVSLTSWASLWGVAGALLSVPITAILVIILSEFDGTKPIAIMLSRNGKVVQERPEPAKPVPIFQQETATATQSVDNREADIL